MIPIDRLPYFDYGIGECMVCIQEGLQTAKCG